MMMKLIALFLLLSSSVGAQNWWGGNHDNNSSTQHKTETERGAVKIIMDEKINELIAFRGKTIPPNNSPQINGYRVQLYFDQQRNNVNEARAKFLKIERDIESYVEYYAPNFNLYVGDFRTKLEAEKLRARLANEFPEAIVVNVPINLPKIPNASAENN
ncbi:MAG: SPOR domain-containing protein [Crocinitomicaceae bacterium]|nr:SPOR domain-containing protein [Crocinitomicaceae bacterium]